MLRRTLIVGLLGFAALTSVVAANGQSSGQPFQRLWAALAQLSNRIAALEARGQLLAPRVVDAQGNVVSSISGTLRNIDGRWFSFNLVEDGFTPAEPPVWYTEPNCEGLEFIAITNSNTGDLAPEVRPLAFTMYVMEGVGKAVGEPFEHRYVISMRNPGSPCSTGPNIPRYIWGGQVTTFDVSALGLVPPFHIE